MFKSILTIEMTDKGADTNLKNEFFREVENCIMTADGWTIKDNSAKQYRIYENNKFISQEDIAKSIMTKLAESHYNYNIAEIIWMRYETTFRQLFEMKNLGTIEDECNKAIKECGCFYYTTDENTDKMLMIYTSKVDEKRELWSSYNDKIKSQSETSKPYEEFLKTIKSLNSDFILN
jgi:hypothetical protein